MGERVFGSRPDEIEAVFEEEGSAAGKEVVRTVMILIGSVDWRVRMALPA